MEDTKPKSFLFAPDEATNEKLEALMKILNVDRTKSVRHAVYHYDDTRKKVYRKLVPGQKRGYQKYILLSTGDTRAARKSIYFYNQRNAHRRGAENYIKGKIYKLVCTPCYLNPVYTIPQQNKSIL